MEERWKILTYNGIKYDKFEISDQGRIRNTETKNIYKTFINHHGYLMVNLSYVHGNKKQIFISIHRAVAQNFVENENNYPIPNHKDKNKLNNYYTNLEWTTYSGNNQHAYDTGLNKKGRKQEGKKKLTDDQVKDIISRYNNNSPELAKEFGVCTQTILNVVHKKHYKDVN